MKIHQLIAELEVRNPDATVYLMNDEGDTVELHRVYNIDDRITPYEKQNIILMEKF